MNFSQILAALNQASAFELFRLQSAIHRKLDDPVWVDSVKKRLRVGQEISYFSSQDNSMRRACVMELRRKMVHISDLDDGRLWMIDYACINIDGIDVQVREQKTKGLGRNEVSVGDTVGFIDRKGCERSGKVIRLNDKTVSLLVDDQQWRVAYVLLHPVVDGVFSHSSPTIELPL
jgi:hypothetical protein